MARPSNAHRKAPARSAVINLRAPSAQRDLIDRAARALGKSRSDFMLDASCRAAEIVLWEPGPLKVDHATFRRIQAILDDPSPPDERWLRTLNAPAPWA